MSSTQPLSVLVADPDVETRDALSAFLFEEGFQPTELEDPSKAPSAIKDGRYQMVLLDLGEPEVDGISLLQKIRSVDDDLCVICMTGQPSVETAVATMKHRAFDYLKKPFEIGELRPVLRDAIREHGLLVNVEKRLNAMVGRTGSQPAPRDGADAQAGRQPDRPLGEPDLPDRARKERRLGADPVQALPPHSASR